jgi:hypothetical protein
MSNVRGALASTMFDQKMSLEELEGQVWPHDDFGSHVVQESQRLRNVPVNQLTIENLRLLIGQRIGLQFFVPVALDILVIIPLRRVTSTAETFSQTY